MRLDLTKRVETAVAEPGRRVLEVVAMFGLGVDASRLVDVVPATTLELNAGELMFVTGPSGGGKSTILRLLRDELPRRGVALIDFDALEPAADRPVIEALAPEQPLASAMRWLSLAGLGDAFVMLRRPGELSEGQRYRLMLARAMAMTEAALQRAGGKAQPGAPRVVLLADEFAATLDRLTAKVVARNLRRWLRQVNDPASDAGVAGVAGVAAVVATSHDDLLEALEPDVLVDKPLGEAVQVVRRDDP